MVIILDSLVWLKESLCYLRVILECFFMLEVLLFLKILGERWCIVVGLFMCFVILFRKVYFKNNCFFCIIFDVSLGVNNIIFVNFGNIFKVFVSNY